MGSAMPTLAIIDSLANVKQIENTNDALETKNLLRANESTPENVANFR
jgi:hypothetical protein